MKMQLITVTRGFKEFCFDCKNLDDLLKIVRPKKIDFKDELQR